MMVVVGHPVAEPGNYLDVLRDAYVLADLDVRRQEIRQQAEACGSERLRLRARGDAVSERRLSALPRL